MLRYLLLALALIGAALLVVAEFTTLYEIKIITVVKETGTAGAHHGYALLIIGVAAAFMAFGALVGGSRPASLALLVLALAALAIVLIVDLPDVDDVGLLAELYEQAQSTPQIGFYLETLGAALLLLAAVANLVLRPGEAARDSATPARGPAAAQDSQQT